MNALCRKSQPCGVCRAPAWLGNRQHRLSQPKGWTTLLRQTWWLLACSKEEILYPSGQQQNRDPVRNRSFYTQGHLHVAVPHCFEIRAADMWQITADRPYHEEKALPPKYHISYCCALNKSVSCLFQRSERHAGQNFKLWQSDLITSVLFLLHKPLIQQHVIKSSFAWKAHSDHKVFCSTVLLPFTV